MNISLIYWFNELYHFIWNDFCDIYIEFPKYIMEHKKILKRFLIILVMVFKNILNLINPIIPFITEKISIDLNYVKKFILKNFVRNFKRHKN